MFYIIFMAQINEKDCATLILPAIIVELLGNKWL